jgi:hypothetical protein
MLLSKELFKLYSEPMIAKFMATTDRENRPNIAFIASIDTWEPTSDFIIFGEFLMVKSLENLGVHKKISTLVMNIDLEFGQVLGDFNDDLQNKGPYFDKISYNEMFRYNAYTKIRTAGTIAVKKQYPIKKVGKLGIVKDLLSVKGKMKRFAGNGGVSLPFTVYEKYNQMQAIKVMAYTPAESDYPFISPVMSLYPIDRNSFAFKVSDYNEELSTLTDGTEVAVMVLTMDPIAYQAKGVLDSFDGKYGRIIITEAYNSSPPLAGDKIA